MRPNPYATANAVSRLFFCWVGDLFIAGRKRLLDSEDLFELDEDDQAKHLSVKLERQWSDEISQASKQKRKPSLWRAMASVFGRFYLLLGVVQCAEELIKVAQPIMIAGLLSAISRRATDDSAKLQAVFFAAAVSLCSVLISTIHHPQFFQVLRIGMWLRVASCSLLYKKVLRLNQQSMLKVSTGKIVNMMTNDVQRMDQACAFLHFLWIGPLLTVIVLAIIWYQVGPAATAGLIALALLSPVQFFIARIFAYIRSKTAVLTDERVKLTSEMIHGMRVVKMYCWEFMFVKLISKVRRRQLRHVTEYVAANCGSQIFIALGGKLTFLVVIAAVFLFCPSLDSVLQPSVVWPVVYLIHILRGLVVSRMLAMWRFVGELTNVFNRLQEVLLLDELDSSKKNSDPEKVLVSLNEFTAAWESNAESPTLSKINLSADKGELIGVIGPVGAGKSSLLMAVLGELPPITGSVDVAGSVAYIAQQPWVFAATVRQNVVFGREWDSELYEASIRAAALDKDLKQLPKGDSTIVGERGVSLSGGQKARVALARGLYSNANIYLLDDPLSAVDTAVGKHLFHRCIRNHLKGRIRILVTHQMQFLKNMDRILVIRGGEVVQSGSYQDLLNSDLDLEAMMVESREEAEPVLLSSALHKSSRALSSSRHFSSNLHEAATTSTYKSSHSLASVSYISLSDICNFEAGGDETQINEEEQQEERAMGSIGWGVYYRYFTAGANCVLLFGLFLLFGLAQAAYVCCDWWLTIWMKWERVRVALNSSVEASSWNETDPFAAEGIGFVRDVESSKFFLLVLGLLTLTVFICTLLRSLGFVAFTISASYTLHQRMLKTVVRARTEFFDRNPVGRILNRFSKDIGVMDEMLPPCLSDFFICSCLVCGNLVVNFIIAPYTIIGVFPLVVLFLLLRQYYMMTSRSVKRLEAVARSPVFSHLNNTLLGLATVRSSGSEKLFTEHYCGLQDDHTRAWFAFLATSRWFGIRLDWLCVAFVMISCSAAVLIQGLDDTQVGLMLTYSVGLLGMFQWCVRQSTEVENHMVSIERVVDYTQLPQEPPFQSPNDKNLPDTWPSVGALQFLDVNFSYNSDGPRVLKDLSFKILPREKIGIVGRTGAGKSSLIYCLFRLSEVESGRILIDAQPTGPPMGLHTLRRSVSIIPQDPVLFTGTVRWNLDPTGLRDDAALWRALDDVQMREPISAMYGGLDAKVAESGVNLSVGQRQLICLARALLGDSRILVIDEATANVDPATDTLIQQTIRSKFCNCTVLTIAHRLHTVMDSDRIMVMEAGQLVEFDHPKVLMENPSSHFSKMVHQLDSTHVQTLQDIAILSYEKQIRRNSTTENGNYHSPNREVVPYPVSGDEAEDGPTDKLLAKVRSSGLDRSEASLNSIFEKGESSPEREPLV